MQVDTYIQKQKQDKKFKQRFTIKGNKSMYLE